MNTQTKGWSVALLTAVFFSGIACGPKTPDAPKPEPTPTPAAPFPITATVSDLETVHFDEKGAIVAKVKAKAATIGPDGKSVTTAAGALQDSTATLYEKGKPTTALTATRIEFDQKTQTVVGIGNVRARSLVEKGSPTVRADSMTWKHKTGKISGSGNVLITREPDLSLAGTRLEGDTNLKSYTLYNDDDLSATGSF